MHKYIVLENIDVLFSFLIINYYIITNIEMIDGIQDIQGTT